MHRHGAMPRWRSLPEGLTHKRRIQHVDGMCAGTADGRPLVQTASEADGVLGGIMRARVLSACRHLHFTCQERAPLLHGAAHLAGGFPDKQGASCSRRAAPAPGINGMV